MSRRIRIAVPGDEQVLAEMNAFVQDLHVENHPSYFKPASLDEVAFWFRGMIEKPAVHVWIAEEDGTDVGYASVILYEREENPFSRARRWIEIDQIGVRPEYQQRGIGRSLIRHILRTAHADGICDVELTSWSFNTGAHAAFRRLGFVPKVIRFGRESSETGD